MRHGEYKFAQQVGMMGYFGKVRLAAELIDIPRVAVRFDDGCNEYWRAGARLGVVYGWKKLRSAQPEKNGVSVQVLQIDGMPCDTTDKIIAFVAANALWNALEWRPDKPPVFDSASGRFTF